MTGLIDKVNDLPVFEVSVASAGQTDFPWSFPVFQPSTDMEVSVLPLGQGPESITVIPYGTAAGEWEDVIHRINDPADPTASPPFDGGGTIRLGTGLAAGDRILISRIMPFERASVYLPRSTVGSAQYENDFDQNVMWDQQTNQKGSDSLTVSPWSPGTLDIAPGLFGQLVVPTVVEDGYAIVYDDDGFLTLRPVTGIGGGEANTASNLPGGVGVFSDKQGVNLRYKSLIGGTNITLDTDANTITIDADVTGSGFDPTLDLQNWGTNAGAQIQWNFLLAGGDVGLIFRNDTGVSYLGGSQSDFKYARATINQLAGSPGSVATPGVTEKLQFNNQANNQLSYKNSGNKVFNMTQNETISQSGMFGTLRSTASFSPTLINDVWVEVTPTSTLSGSAQNVDSPSNGRIRINYPSGDSEPVTQPTNVSGTFTIFATLISDTNNTTFQLAPMVDGVEDTEFAITVLVRQSNTTVGVTIPASGVLAHNTSVSLGIRRPTGGGIGNPTIDDTLLGVYGLPFN